MTAKRPFGVTLIAVYFLLKSAVLISAAIVGHLKPVFRSSANELISHLAPLIKDFGAFDFIIVLAPLFALFEIVKGFGFWFLQRWVRLLALAEIFYYFGRGGLGLVLLWEIDRRMFLSITSSPFFLTGLVERVVVCFYLLDPDVKRAFGVPDGQSW